MSVCIFTRCLVPPLALSWLRGVLRASARCDGVMRPHLRPTGSRPGQAQQPPSRHERAGGGRGGAARSPPAAAAAPPGASAARGSRPSPLRRLAAGAVLSASPWQCQASSARRGHRGPWALPAPLEAAPLPAPGSRPQAGPRRPRGGRCPARSPRQEMRSPARNLGGGEPSSDCPPAPARPLPAPRQHQEPSQLQPPPPAPHAGAVMLAEAAGTARRSASGPKLLYRSVPVCTDIKVFASSCWRLTNPPVCFVYAIFFPPTWAYLMLWTCCKHFTGSL